MGRVSAHIKGIARLNDMEMNAAKPNYCATCCFLDVGQGTSQVVLLSNRRTIVIDTGPQSPQGKSPVVRLLQEHQIETIEALVLSHNDSDHVGDIKNIVDAFPEKIKRIYLLKDRGRERSRQTLCTFLKTAARQRNFSRFPKG